MAATGVDRGDGPGVWSIVRITYVIFAKFMDNISIVL